MNDTFPIYCKTQGESCFHMIISNSKVMTLTDAPNEIGVKITDFDIDHAVYDEYKAGELIDISKTDFHFQRIEMFNNLVRRSKSE